MKSFVQTLYPLGNDYYINQREKCLSKILLWHNVWETDLVAADYEAMNEGIVIFSILGSFTHV